MIVHSCTSIYWLLAIDASVIVTVVWYACCKHIHLFN